VPRRLEQLSPILYKWKPETGFDASTTYAGFSAQNVQAAIPEAVGQGKDKKLDQIITMLGDVVDIFGKRFDKIERDMATKDQIVALHAQVNSIETQLRGMKHGRLETRVADLEDKVFGTARS
jgi:hypothetical protein